MHGRNFQLGDYCLEGSYLGVIVQGQLSSGELFKGQLFVGNCLGGIPQGQLFRGKLYRGNRPWGKILVGNCPGSSCPGGGIVRGNYPGVIALEAVVQRRNVREHTPSLGFGIFKYAVVLISLFQPQKCFTQSKILVFNYGNTLSSSP